MTYKEVPLPDGMPAQVEAFVASVIDTLEADGRLSPLDYAALYFMAESYTKHLYAEAAVAAEGVSAEGARGCTVPNPAVKVARDSMRDCMDIFREFGLTLASRGRIKEIAKTTESTPLQDFMELSKNK